MKNMKNLNDLFQNQICMLYGAEKECSTTLKQLAKAAHTPALRTEIEGLAKATSQYVTRLEDVFKAIDVKPTAKPCKPTESLLQNCSTIASDIADEEVRDAALVAAIRSVQHHEIAGYECAQSWAKTLNHKKAGELLQATLDEAQGWTKRFMNVGTTVNPAALHHAVA